MVLKYMKPHPTLKKPTIFSGPLPSGRVKEHQLSQLVRGVSERVTISLRADSCTPAPGEARRSFVRFDFVDLASAEKALIVLNDLPIPGTTPVVYLTLTVRPPDQAYGHPPPLVDVYPRIIKRLEGTKTRTNMYDLLRPSGPIYYVKDDAVLGHRVQFYSEEDASCAAERLMNIATLQAYHPRSVYCTNVPLNEQSIREIFKECGTIAEIVLSPYGGPGAKGFVLVTFSLPQEAEKAIRRVHGTRIAECTKPVMVRYRHVSRPGAQTTKGQCTKEWDAQTERSESDLFAEQEPIPVSSATDVPSNFPSGTNISDQWDQMWRREAKRLEEELRRLRRGGPLVNELEVYKIQLEKEAEIGKLREEMGREKSTLEKLHSEEVTVLRMDMAELRGELKASTAKIADLERDLLLSESRRKILELEIHRPMWERATQEREPKKAEEHRYEELAKAQRNT